MVVAVAVVVLVVVFCLMPVSHKTGKNGGAHACGFEGKDKK